jgi:hypothetical protein
MPFEKGNKLATVNKGKSKPKTQAWENIVGWLVGDGGQAFKNKIEALSVGAELTKEEKEFIGHYKDLLEFHQPKLARNDDSLNVKGNVTVESVSYGDKNKDTV